MWKRIVTVASLIVPMVLVGNAAASATETQQFRGEGSSSFGFAYDYAYFQALNRAQDAGFDGFDDCEIVDDWESPGGYFAWVVLECVRAGQ